MLTEVSSLKNLKKYKDYLIAPVISMYVLFASCAYIGQNVFKTAETEAPQPTVSPAAICWDGDSWYAGGSRGTASFTVVKEDTGSNEVYFSNSRGSMNAVSYRIDDMHLLCCDGESNYDIIFLDEVTAYDCNSGVYYQRADYNKTVSALTSGKFVNTANKADYYEFKSSGKSVEYCGDKVYSGKWNLETSDSIQVYDNTCKGSMGFELVYDASGNISGMTYNNNTYVLEI